MKNANPLSGFGRALWLAVLLLAAGCGGDETTEPPKTVHDYFPIQVGAATVHLQLALSDAEMERGLMERTDLRGNQGMLFVYRQPRAVGFWMRNTPTPLEIGYFTGDGVLREVYPLYPYDDRSVRSRRDDIQYAMEVTQGWFDFTGVKPGDRLDLKAVAAAIKARGYPVREYEGL